MVESFAGTHDYLGGQLPGWYDPVGNTSNKNLLQKTGATITTVGAIPVSAPFAMADLMSSDFVELLMKLGGN